MRSITPGDLKRHGAKAIPKGHVVYLIVHSKPQYAIVPIDQYEALLEMLEDIDDARVIEERRHEGFVPFDDVFPPEKA